MGKRKRRKIRNTRRKRKESIAQIAKQIQRRTFEIDTKLLMVVMMIEPTIDPIECQLETCLRGRTKEIKMVISETSIILETVALEMIGEEADPEKENLEVDQGRGGIEVDLVREGTTEVGAMIEVEETEDDHINKCT